GLGTTPGANVSPEYFGDLLHSREILTSALLSSFPDPDAHAATPERALIDLLNEFNLQRRQSQSRAQRQFTEQRLEQAERELREAEGAQLHFLEANRRYSESPLLAFQGARLERAVQ